MPTDAEIMLDKLQPLLSILYKYIDEGSTKARSFFDAEEEPPDPWLFSHIVRWHICKRLDSLKDPHLSYERSPQAMSGIEILYEDRYIKVFKASDGELPAAGRSHARQEFYKGNLFDEDELGLPIYLAVIWEVNGHYQLLDIQLDVPMMDLPGSLDSKSGRRRSPTRWSLFRRRKIPSIPALLN